MCTLLSSNHFPICYRKNRRFSAYRPVGLEWFECLRKSTQQWYQECFGECRKYHRIIIFLRMGQLPNQLNVCGEHHRLVTLQMIDADVLAPHSTIFQLLAGPTNHNDKDLWNCVMWFKLHRYNSVCHPVGHYWNHSPCALSLKQVNAAHLSTRYGCPCSTELQRLGHMIGYQDSSPNNRRQVTCPPSQRRHMSVRASKNTG